MKCIKCGAEIPPGKQFCIACGTRQPSPAPPPASQRAVPAPSPPVQPPVTPPPAPVAPPPEPAQRKVSRFLIAIFGGVALLLLVALCLVLALVLRQPSGPTQATATPPLVDSPATITEVINQVEAHSRPGDAWRAAAVNMLLYNGGQVRTFADSSARITLEDGAVRVAANSVFTVQQYQKQGDNRLARFLLEVGRVWVHLDEPVIEPSVFEIETATGVAAVRDTRYSVQIDPDGTMLVSVDQGKAVVRAQGAEVIVRAGQQVTVLKGQPPGPVSPMSVEEQTLWLRYAVGPKLLVSTPTPTPVPTPVPTETDTPTPLPTDTPLPTETPELTNTPTATPTSTETPTSTPTATATSPPTATPTLTPTPGPTFPPLSVDWWEIIDGPILESDGTTWKVKVRIATSGGDPDHMRFFLESEGGREVDREFWISNPCGRSYYKPHMVVRVESGDGQVATSIPWWIPWYECPTPSP
ncbi:MAG: FecR domain-containing protein [Anaerolineae bacterium]|nr:FecR domain-containing protein [Anaerolineae bacterium]